MSYRAEDKLRTVLSTRVSAVDTPPGWAVVEREPVADRVEYHLVYVEEERRVEIETGEPPTSSVDDLAVSGDGTRLAWTSTGGGATTLHLAALPEGGQVPSPPVAGGSPVGAELEAV